MSLARDLLESLKKINEAYYESNTEFVSLVKKYRLKDKPEEFDEFMKEVEKLPDYKKLLASYVKSVGGQGSGPNPTISAFLMKIGKKMGYKNF